MKLPLVSSLPFDQPLTITITGDSFPDDFTGFTDPVMVNVFYSNRLFENLLDLTSLQSLKFIGYRNEVDCGSGESLLYMYPASIAFTQQGYSTDTFVKIDGDTYGIPYDVCYTNDTYTTLAQLYNDVQDLISDNAYANTDSLVWKYDGGNIRTYTSTRNNKDIFLTEVKSSLDPVQETYVYTIVGPSQGFWKPISQDSTLVSTRIAYNIRTSAIQDYKYDIQLHTDFDSTQLVKSWFPSVTDVCNLPTDFSGYSNENALGIDIYGEDLAYVIQPIDSYFEQFSSKEIEIPWTSDVLQRRNIEVTRTIRERSLRTVSVQTDWDQGSNGPTLLYQTIDAYDTTPITIIKNLVQPQGFTIYAENSDRISQTNTTAVMYRYYEDFLSPNNNANHVIHLSGTITSIDMVGVYSNWVSVNLHGTCQFSIDNFAFTWTGSFTSNPGTSPGTSDLELYQIAARWDDTIGWYIDSVIPFYWGENEKTEKSFNNADIDVDTFLYPKSSNSVFSSFIVPNGKITELCNLDSMLAGNISQSIRFDKSSTAFSKNKDLFASHKNDTQWSQLPSAFRNKIKTNWSIDIKETEWTNERP